MIEASHLEKSYGRRRVLVDVSFGVGRGELVGIVGENGSGKTTLLEVLVGLSSPNRGSISIDGRFGYCPQACQVFDLLTVDENLDYFSTAYGLSRADAADRRRRIAQRFRFEQYLGTLGAELSAGTRQKVNLAVALLHDPDVLILDEPYNGFDWETFVLFWDYVGEALSKDKTIVIVSHLIYDESRFDQLLTLKDGVLVTGGGQGCAQPT